MAFLRISETGALPDANHLAPFRAALVIEQVLSESRQNEISRWLCSSGCLYMCAWGVNCESWDTSVDEANLEEFDFGEIPGDRFVMTTWHSEDSLEDFFFFVKYSALHPSIDLQTTAIVYLGADDRQKELQAYLGDT